MKIRRGGRGACKIWKIWTRPGGLIMDARRHSRTKKNRGGELKVVNFGVVTMVNHGEQ